jgi:hypothetical protein
MHLRVAALICYLRLSSVCTGSLSCSSDLTFVIFSNIAHCRTRPKQTPSLTLCVKEFALTAVEWLGPINRVQCVQSADCKGDLTDKLTVAQPKLCYLALLFLCTTCTPICSSDIISWLSRRHVSTLYVLSPGRACIVKTQHECQSHVVTRPSRDIMECLGVPTSRFCEFRR